jgi:hypothetical protein
LHDRGRHRRLRRRQHEQRASARSGRGGRDEEAERGRRTHPVRDGPQQPQLQGKAVRLRGTGAIDGKSEEMSFNLGSMLGQMGIPSRAANGTLKHAKMTEIALEQNGDYVMQFAQQGLGSTH